MAWKPKEKPLTLEEAVALAKKELAPFWIGSEPLLAGVRAADGRITVHPLSESFEKRNWLLVFLDPTSFSGDAAFSIVREWHRRYSVLDLGIVVVLSVAHAALRKPEAIEALLPRQQQPFTVVMDAQGMLVAAFSVKSLPSVLLLGSGKPVLQSSGPEWLQGSELDLQRFLRAKDPGLPLPPPLEQSQDFPHDLDAISFMNGKSGPVSEKSLSTLKGVPVSLSGSWLRDGECLIPADENARIRFDAPGPDVAVVAQSRSTSPLPAEIFVELMGRSAWEEVSGEDIQFSEDGGSVMRVRAGRMYRMLRHLPPGERSVTLSFRLVRENPIGLYAIRFGR